MKNKLYFDSLENWEKQIIDEIIEKINPSNAGKTNIYRYIMKKAMTELISTLKFHEIIKITY